MKGFFSRIANALLVEYVRVYYLDAQTDAYTWYSSETGFNAHHFDQSGSDFYSYLINELSDMIYEEDRQAFLARVRKDKLLPRLRANMGNEMVYRLIIDGKPIYHSLKLLDGRSGEGEEYYILGVRDIDYVTRNNQRTRIFSQIAQSMARRFEVVYYVDIRTDQYYEFSDSDLLHVLDDGTQGENFFDDAVRNADGLVHPDDKSRVLDFLKKDRLLGNLAAIPLRKLEYRLLTDELPVYVRLCAMFTEDEKHIILSVENVDREVRELRAANSAARMDSLTGVKNKLAYHEFEHVLQEEIDKDSGAEFSIIVFDVNDLKRINDTRGHAAGDLYIKRACSMICGVFTHSPVFRIGGDEFVTVLMRSDYEKREELYSLLSQTILEQGPVVAAGMATYIPGMDKTVGETFRRADEKMYENKRAMKNDR